MKNILVCCLALSFTLLPAFAQVDTGSVAGSIRDSSGAGLPSATVTFVETLGKGTAQILHKSLQAVWA
jgi:hypothetical protein